MSVDVISAVWKRSWQKSGPLLVLLALADYTNKKGVAFPAMSTLADKVRMSKRNAQRCMHTLEEAGKLKVVRKQGRCNIYRILLPNTEVNDSDEHVIGDSDGARPVSSAALTDDTSAAQSVIKPLKESTPTVPTGDGIDFWLKVCFDCFEQIAHPLPPHVLRALARAIPSLHKTNADSLSKFYRSEELSSKEPPYNSRKHSPERLILDLPRQLALAIQKFPPLKPPPPPKEYSFTIEEACEYLCQTYGNCRLPQSLPSKPYGSSGRLRPDVRRERFALTTACLFI